jgi:hypothetical protein
MNQLLMIIIVVIVRRLVQCATQAKATAVTEQAQHRSNFVI